MISKVPDPYVSRDRSEIVPILRKHCPAGCEIELSDRSRISVASIAGAEADSFLVIPVRIDGREPRRIEIRDVVRIRGGEQGEMLWETPAGQIVWEDKPPSRRFRLAALAALLLATPIALNKFLGWGWFGKYDNWAFALAFFVMLVVVARAPRIAEHD